MPYIQANGLSIHYEDRGSGVPLILLHGSFDCTCTMWKNQIGPFSEQYRVIIPDLRGHGKTANPGGPITLGDLADDALALSRKLELVKPVLCGISMGGMAVLEAGMRYPDAFRALVVGAAHVHRPFPIAFQERIRSIGMLEAEKADPAVLENSNPDRVARLRASHTVYPDQWKDLLLNLTATFFNSPHHRLQDYSKIIAPVLVVTGDRDDAFQLEHMVELYRALPDAELAVLPGHHHTSFFSTPDSPLAPLVLDFLKRVSLRPV